jgi:hypothetical protein
VVTVNARKRAIDGRVNVTATLEQPRVGIGSLIADAKVPDTQGRGFEPGMTAAERQLAALATDPQRWKQLTTPRITAVRFKADGKGAFRGTLGNVTVPGIYRATVRISGEDRQLGRFERSQSLTAIVRFGAADRQGSELALGRKNNSFELSLRPRDRHGNLLGPGLAQEIKLAELGGKTAAPEDLGNGRYRFVVSSDALDRPVTLTVGEHPMFRGALQQLRAGARRR